jgi:signal transduction histidine kinase
MSELARRLSVDAPGDAVAGDPHPPAGEASARAAAGTARRLARLRQEFLVRGAVSVLILLFNELMQFDHEMASVIRLTALLGLGINLPYLLAIRTAWALRAQAYLRMLVDIALMTAGLYGAGGLGAAQYLVIYAIVPVYTAIVFSSLACVLAVLFATVAYLALALLQTQGVLPFIQPPLSGAWIIAAFNLLVLNIVGWLAAVLAEAYRVSQQRLAGLYGELERAHDQSLQLNTQLQLATQRYVLSEVVAGITHEARDALQSAFGHLWLARRGGAPLPEPALEHLSQVEQACEDAMRIMCTTLDMSRRPEPEHQLVVVAEVARGVAQLKAVEMRRERITLIVDVPDTLPLVLGTPLQLQQLLLNLVVNAQEELRGAARRREITIAGRAYGDRVVVEVRDTGRGMMPSVLAHVFEPFYTTKPSATGLGLAISAGIAESLRGTLAAENRREGGAVVRLTLPAAPPTRPPAAS